MTRVHQGCSCLQVGLKLFVFVFVVLTSVLNTNQKKNNAGAARADIRLQALQYNKRRERDPVTLGT